MEILTVSKVTKSTSSNKILRFRWGKNGQSVRIEPKDDGYAISTAEDAPGEEHIVKETTAYPYFRYIEVGRTINYDGYMAMLKNGNNFYVRPASEKEIARYAKRSPSLKGENGESGYVRRAVCGVTISTPDFIRLWKTDTIRVKVVMTKKKLFVEAKAISPDEAEGYMTMAEAVSAAGGYENIRTAKNVTLIYKREFAKMDRRRFAVPTAFVRRAGSADGTKYNTWFKDDDTFVMCAATIYCDVCGKPVDRYFTESNYVCTCSKCADKIGLDRYKAKSMIKDRERDGLDEIARDLAAVKDRLTGMLSAGTAQ